MPAGFRRLAALMLAPLLVLAAFITVADAATPATVEAETDQGFARLVFKFPKLPKYRISTNSGVLVIEFGEAVEIQLEQVPVKVADYIVVGRLDPDGKAARFALARKIRVNTTEAGSKLFVDLLPNDWAGMPPSLPKDVLAELQARAEEAAEIARKKAARAEALAKKFILEVRSGEQPTFSRLVFEWDNYVEARLERDGGRVNVRFDEPAKPDLSILKVDRPKNIKTIGSSLEEEGLRIFFDVDPRSNVRGFREGLSYVVDIYDAPEDDVAAKVVAKADAQDGPLAAAAAAADADNPAVSPQQSELVDLKAATRPAGAQPAAPRNDADRDRADQLEPMPADAKEPVAETPDKAGDRNVLISDRKLDRNGAIAAKDEPMAAEAGAKGMAGEKPDTKSEMPREPRSNLGLAQDMEEPSPEMTQDGASARPRDKDDAGPVVAEVGDAGNALRVTFPFTAPTPAAVFQRAKTLWIVFDTGEEIDIAGLAKSKSRLITHAEVQRSGDARVVRVDLSAPLLATAGNSADGWTVTIADLIIEPTAPVSLKRGLRSDGLATVTVDFAHAGKVHWLKDPKIGDRLAVVTGLGPARGFIKPQSFVEFSTLATAHGIVVKPLSDDLSVRLNGDLVLITRKEGLTLSAGKVQQYAPGRKSVANADHPGFIDFKGWARGGPEAYSANVASLSRIISWTPVEKSIGPRLDLTRLYLSQWLGIEALGQIRLIKEIDPEIDADPVFHAMRGVANLLAGRLAEARSDLSVHGLSQDPHAAMWAAVVEAEDGNWRTAQTALRKSEKTAQSYPQDVQLLVRILSVRAAIENNDLGSAEYSLDILPKNDLPAKIANEARLLRARLLQALGQTDEALEIYAEAEAGDSRKIEAEAIYRETLLQLSMKRIEKTAAIARLETASLMWRGDDIELNVMRKLAALLAEEGKHRRALETMRVAVRSYPEKEIARLMQQDMVEIFKKMFLDGQADDMPPVEALALYYDFRALTPVGRHGDEMIRKLADRLIGVDLLEQAAEILLHQVDKRLTGTARAQVAAKLALVQLMNHLPARALSTIRRTRQAVVSNDLREQRVLLEARALAELGRTDQAVELLSHIEGDRSAHLRAEALWMGSNWQAAGEAYENNLGDAWQGAEPLSEAQRVWVLRAAISYTLSEDHLGLERFARKFAPKMSSSPDADAFRVVTGAVDRQAIAFRNLAREVASVDTLEKFLADFRKGFDLSSSQDPARPGT